MNLGKGKGKGKGEVSSSSSNNNKSDSGSGRKYFLNMGVIIYNPEKKDPEEPRILQFHFSDKSMNVTSKGKIKASFTFANLNSIDKRSGKEFRIQFSNRKEKQLRITTQTIDDGVLLETIVKKISRQDDDLAFEDVFKEWMTIRKFGNAKKKGKTFWSKRYLVLYSGQLVVYRNETEETPLNIIVVNQDTGKVAQGKNEIVLKANFRCFSFRFESSTVRDEWLEKLSSSETIQRLRADSIIVDFSSGQLAKLTRQNKKICKMAQLHPTECEKNFDTLLKVLKI